MHVSVSSLEKSAALAKFMDNPTVYLRFCACDFLVMAVLLFIRNDWLTGALFTLASIVNGVGIKWVLDRRNEAVAEESEAKKDLLDNCGRKIAAEGVRAMGLAQQTKSSAVQISDDSPLKEIENKFKLFGLFR